MQGINNVIDFPPDQTRAHWKYQRCRGVYLAKVNVEWVAIVAFLKGQISFHNFTNHYNGLYIWPDTEWPSKAKAINYDLFVSL